MTASPQKRIYFDHSATTRVLPEVADAIYPFLVDRFGNASSLHSYGRDAKSAMENARRSVSQLINADPGEIYFTSGGTESDNLAIKGSATYKGRSRGHIVTSSIEHGAVLQPCRHLKGLGFDVTELTVSPEGLLEASAVEEALREDTVLVTIMAANSEIGTVQPIGEIGKIVQSRGIPFHTDAVQAIGKLPIDVKEEGIDMLSISAHKFHGPKGVGALFVKKGTEIEPIIHGGGHEHGLRSSTENVPGIVGLGKAAEIAMRDMGPTCERLQTLRDRIIDSVPDLVPQSYLNGHRMKRLVNNANFRFDFVEGEALILKLDMEGIAASTGSACSTQALEPSHVLLALGLRHEQAHGSLRISLGRENTEEEVDRLLEVLPGVVSKLREISPFNKDRPMEAGDGDGCVH